MYKFRCELRGHTADVRCIVNYDEDVIISGSRDMVSRVWIANDEKFDGGPILCGHTDYVASICIVPSSDLYPEGLIVTGSNDCSICAYTPTCADIQFKLTSHSGTVCCVNAAHQRYGLLSSSWDCTIIMWNLCTKSIDFKIPGNNTPVWSVIQLECGTIITASADKIIRTYTSTGEHITNYYGHTDCVRCLYPINKTDFVSCGNDGYVLRWKADDCKSVTAVDSIPHFLYSICFLPSKNMLVYCGEKGVIYVNSGNVSTIIHLPCSTVWAVTILPDGDIAAGCNDGKIRVYSCDPERWADQHVLLQYDNEVEKCTQKALKEKFKSLNPPYLNDLCAPVDLNSCGLISSELLFVRSGFFAVMYSWSTDRWIEIAKRKGTYQYDITTKKMYDGKAYDYLFPINIDDSKPNLILPITLGDNILTKVNSFVMHHKLAASYCETIYTHVANSIKDDFLSASNLDCESTDKSPEDTYFPRSGFICFEKGNISQIIAKLHELASSHNINIPDDKTEILKLVTDPKFKCSIEDCEYLLTLLEMPSEIIFPIFDLLRLALRNKSFYELVLTDDVKVNKILQPLKSHMGGASPINKLMVLKVFCNMFDGNAGRMVVLEEFEYLVSSLAELQFPPLFYPSLQVSASSLLLNLIILSERTPLLHPNCLGCAITLTDSLQDKEALFRLFVAIGNLISYEGSFFIPKGCVDKLKAMYIAKKCDGSSAHSCLRVLLKCFQDDV